MQGSLSVKTLPASDPPGSVTVAALSPSAQRGLCPLWFAIRTVFFSLKMLAEGQRGARVSPPCPASWGSLEHTGI